MLPPVLFFFLFCCTPKPENDKRKIFSSQQGSQLFSIADSQNYKIVHVFTNVRSSIPAYSYVLYHRGTPQPSVNFKAQYVQTPVERVACLSNIFVGCLQKLNLEEKIVAVDNSKRICNVKVRSMYNDGKIQELAVNDQLNIESTLLLKPDLIFTYGTGNIENDIDRRLIDGRIPVAISVDHYENSPLARASWLRFVSVFFEKEDLADSLIYQTEKKYNELKNLTANIKQKPSVLTEVKYNDTWYVPGGKSFMSLLLKDAGANYFWQNDTNSGSLALSYEDVFLKAAETDYWINVHHWNNLEDCLKQDERNKSFKAFRDRNLYNNNALTTGEDGNAYWETGLISPDEILMDLIKIFHPEILPDHQLKYYRKLN